MSALAELRQVMSAPRHVPRDYDTDTVSVTSTISDNEDFYTPTGIIAEAPGEERPYLVAWKDYPISQCTWEPPYHLDGTTLIEDWNKIKQELGNRAFEELSLKNIEDFEQAQDEAMWAQQLKLEKREKKRQRLKQRNRRVVHDEDSSDDEPLVRVRGKNDLFVGTQETQPSRPSSPLTKATPPRQHPVARKAPLEQSSSDSDTPSVRRNQLGSSTTGTKPKQPQTANRHPQTANQQPQSRPQQPRPTIIPPQPMAKQPQSMTKQPQPKIKKTKQTEQRSTSTINFINKPKTKQHREWSENHQYTRLKYRGLAEKKSHTEGTPDFSALSFPPTFPRPATSRPNDDLYARRETTNRRVQEDDPYAGRRTTDYRAQEAQSVPLADWEKYKTPMMCYHFCHQLPCPGGDKYNCRFMHREHDPQGKPYPVGNYSGFVDPKDRPQPVTCLYWLKGGCINSTEKCTYAHNNTGWTEFQGRLMEIRHLNQDLIAPSRRIEPKDRNSPTGIKHPLPKPTDDGRIKPKDRNPPIMCNKGDKCEKSAEDCPFAHKDIGRKDNGLPTKTTQFPSQLTASVADKVPSSVLRSEREKITCHFWLRDSDGCCMDNCTYAHRNTGWALPGAYPKARPVRIDPTQKPLGVPPKHAEPPVTCPHWLRSYQSCDRPPAECKYAHWNTGWAPPGLTQGKPQPINPKQQPVFRKNAERTSRLARSNDDASPAQAEHKTAPSGPRSANDGLSWFRKIVPTEASLQTTQDRPTTRPSPPPYITDDSDNAAVETSTDVAMDAAPASKHNHVQSPVAMQDVPQNKSPAVLRSSELRSKIESLWNLNFVEMFNSGRPGDMGILKRQAMLLYSPQDHPQEIELITRWLLMYDVEVSNLWHDGAWSRFRENVVKDKSGVIIAHPDFVHYIDLPGFGKLLTQDVRVWSVGVQLPWYEVGVGPEPTEMERNRINIFPHGGFIYITDEVFHHTPQLALKIISLFFDKIELLRKLDSPVLPWLEVPDAFLIWRICVRPELMDYLYQKCNDNEAEIAAENPEFMSYYHLYMRLHTTNYIEQDCPSAPLTMIPDKYPILSERREIAQLAPLDYFNVLAKSQEDANTSMIGYYAALQSNDMRRHYRNFYVVHTEPGANCAQHWKDTIHNISDVITPERCAEELEKPGKGSLFDFLDWAMEPKGEGDDAGAGSDDESMGDAPMDISPVRGRKEGRRSS